MKSKESRTVRGPDFNTMTTITDTDLELLEAYLDGEVSGTEADALQQRLRAEPELSAAMDDLRSQRAIRQSLWQSLEPDQKTADQFAWRIRGAIETQRQTPARRKWDTWQFARFGSAAAACVVLGFFVGWVGRGHHANVSSVVSPPSHNESANSVAQVQMVPVTNEYGQVVAWQPFKDQNDAKAFVEDLHRANTAAPTNAPPDDKVKLISSEEKF